MPLPKPGDKENRRDFLSRCMGDEIMNRDYEDNQQRYAVCNSQWRREKLWWRALHKIGLLKGGEDNAA
jgi:hypothetical protein